MRTLSIAVLIILGSVVTNERALAIDTSYVITISSPTNYQVVSAGNSVAINGNVDWPWYKPDVDQMKITIQDTSLNVIASEQKAYDTGLGSYLEFSSDIGWFESPGTYIIIVDALKNGVVLNTKSVIVIVQ